LTTDTSSNSERIVAVTDELKELMRKKKGQVKIASFPAVVAAGRVQTQAKRLGLRLKDGEELRQVLRETLNALAEQEGREDERDYPFAKPAAALLGLTEKTAYRTIAGRQEEAAKERGVAQRTIRNAIHEPRIAHELAVYLLQDGQQSSAKERYRKDLILVLSCYTEFHRALRELHDSLQELGDYADIADDAEFYVCLFAFSKNVVQRGPVAENLHRRTLLILIAEHHADRNRYQWLGRILSALGEFSDTDTLPILFGLRARELLRYACNEADGNLHVFLRTLENTELGTQLLKEWLKRFQPRSYRPLEFSKTHHLWMRGLAAAFHLVNPKELTEEVEAGIALWLVEHGGTSDMEWATGLLAKEVTPLIEDSARDREFLHSIYASLR
jgi:hypothetical protein